MPTVALPAGFYFISPTPLLLKIGAFVLKDKRQRLKINISNVWGFFCSFFFILMCKYPIHPAFSLSPHSLPCCHAQHFTFSEEFNKKKNAVPIFRYFIRMIIAWKTRFLASALVQLPAGVCHPFANSIRGDFEQHVELWLTAGAALSKSEAGSSLMPRLSQWRRNDHEQRRRL